MGLNHAGFDSDFYRDCCPVARRYSAPGIVGGMLLIFAAAGVILLAALAFVAVCAWLGWRGVRR